MFGIPKEIITDRGTAFTSNDFENFVEKQKIYHRKVAVASPWANGLVERINRFIINTFKRIVVDPERWEELLGTIQYVTNNTYHSVIKATPSKLLLGYDQRNHSDRILAKYVDELTKVDSDLQIERSKQREISQEATQKIREYNKVYFDKSHKKSTMYNVGDYIMLRDTQGKTGEHNKFKVNYKGPYIIHKCLRNNRYVIRDIPGFNITAKALDTIVSSDKIKPWVKPINNSN